MTDADVWELLDEISAWVRDRLLPALDRVLTALEAQIRALEIRELERWYAIGAADR